MELIVIILIIGVVFVIVRVLRTGEGDEINKRKGIDMKKKPIQS